ncbi:MAG: hypothetical protein R3C28_26515 [Pirellulaceae bacterium]
MTTYPELNSQMIVEPSNSLGHQAGRTSVCMTRAGTRITMAVLLIWILALGIGFEAALVIQTMLGFAVALLALRSAPAVGLLGVGMLCTTDNLARAFLLQGGWFRYHTLNYFLLLVVIVYLPLVLRLGGIQIRFYELFLLLASVQLLMSPAFMSGASCLSR